MLQYVLTRKNNVYTLKDSKYIWFWFDLYSQTVRRESENVLRLRLRNMRTDSKTRAREMETEIKGMEEKPTETETLWAGMFCTHLQPKNTTINEKKCHC